MKKIIAVIIFISFYFFTEAQLTFTPKTFTHSDTLRGSVTRERAWWDVMRYDITVKPDYLTKTIAGKVVIGFIANDEQHTMQIDLQAPLIIDSVIYNGVATPFSKADTNVWYVKIRKLRDMRYGKEPIKIVYPYDSITVFYHGTPREAVNPPWDGGWVWTKDSLGRPWMSVACQGIGASVWYPCKDYQGDEPDSGASLTVTVPDTLIEVGNGRLKYKQHNNDGTTTYDWEVKAPINNYNIVPYIGKYVNFSEVYKGDKGNLDVNYWVLDYNINRAKSHIQPDVERMLKAFEYWMGPYPFYEDGYKIVDAPYLGMEHQSAIAYGNKYREGYLGKDRSGTGWGLKWDFIIVHESGHEWFGNSITSKDIADMWIHEGFTTYSQTLFTEYYYGKQAGNEYNTGERKNIRNNESIIGSYNVNNEGSEDEYEKASNMINLIRHSMDDDTKFRSILQGLNKTFYHQTVTTQQVESYISEQAGFNYSKVFDQYLRTIQIPQFEFYFSENKKKVFYRWANCVKDFNLPLVLKNDEAKIKLYPAEQWKSINVSNNEKALFNPVLIESLFYINAKKVIKAE